MALASSGVAVDALLDAIFGRSGRANMMTKRPFASKTLTPFGSAPNRWNLLPSWFVWFHETTVQVPTSWSLSDCCWLVALLGSKASPNAAITGRPRMLRRFIVLSFDHLEG